MVSYDPNVISKSELARRRGVTPATVTRWVRKNRVVLDSSDRVLYAETLGLLQSTENPQSKASSRSKENKQAEDKTQLFNHWFGDPEESEPAENPPPVDDSVKQFFGSDDNYPELVEEIKETTVPTNSGHWEMLLNNSKAMKERAFALKAAAEYDKTINKLVDKSLVERAVFERSRAFRDALTVMGKRLAAELSAMDNPIQIEKLIEQECRLILEQFAALPLLADVDNSWAARIGNLQDKDN